MDTKFTDLHGGTWEVDLTYGILETIKKEVGVDLFDILGDKNQERLAEQLADNSITFQVIYIICLEQCESRGMSPEDFGKAFKLVHVRKAWKAVRVGLLDFFQGTSEGEVLKIIFSAEDEMEKELKRAMDEAVPVAQRESVKLQEQLREEILKAVEESEAQQASSDVDYWELGWRLGGLTNRDHRRYSLRQLWWMASGAFETTAALLLMLYDVNRDHKKSQNKSADFFNPYRPEPRTVRQGIPMTMDNLKKVFGGPKK